MLAVSAEKVTKFCLRNLVYLSAKLFEKSLVEDSRKNLFRISSLLKIMDYGWDVLCKIKMKPD